MKPVAQTARRRDVFTKLVTMAAIVVFAILASIVLPHALKILLLASTAPMDRLMVVSLMLDIVLILIGWSHYQHLEDEVERQARAGEEAQTLARLDPLTGMLNRRSLAEELAAGIDAVRPGTAMALMVIDLDNFKNVNDLYGHMIGDEVLRRVASSLCAGLPGDALVSRMGGDEFAVALVFPANASEAVNETAENIVRSLQTPMLIDGVQAHVGASVGIAVSSAQERVSADSLLRRADIAMYVAKRGGRGRCTWFDRGMEDELGARNEIEAGIRHALAANEFVPYYECQIDLQSCELRGFEVLARWNHPTRGIVEPDSFIGIAEESGLIGELFMTLVRRALVETRDLDYRLSVSINISYTQLKDPWLAEKLLQLLVQTGFPADRLEVEITETALFDNLPLAQSMIRSLKNQGIRLALDDFGIGYSSLHHLRALPFDRIKIDKSFTQSILDNNESEATVIAIARIAESLKLPLTAGGIVSAAIAERLSQIGCSRGQGWHFGRPMPIADVHDMLGMAPTPVPVSGSVSRFKRSRQAG